MNHHRFRKLQFLLFLFFGFGVGLFPFNGCASWAFAGQQIRVGLMLSKGDPESTSNLSYLRGAEMAVSELNSKEGRRGMQILLFIHEGLYGSERGLNALQELIVDGRLHFLMGALQNSEILPVSRLARTYRLPLLVFPKDFMEAPSTGEEPINLFWISPAPEAFQRAAVRTVAQFSQKRYFLIARDSPVGRSWGKYFWEELKRIKPGAQGVGELYLSQNIEDYEPFIQAILSANSEICLSYLGPKGLIPFAKRAKKIGYFRKISHFELESGDLDSLVALKRENLEGVWGTSAFPFWALGWKETHEFINQYMKKNKGYPDLNALSAYISVHAIQASFKRAGGHDLEKLIAALQSLTLRTPVGSLAIRKSDNRALWPIWCGMTKLTPDYPFAILSDLKAFGPDSFSP